MNQLCRVFFNLLTKEKYHSKGQHEAAQTVGMTEFQAYRRIILPQVVEHCMSVLCNQVTGIVKMSSLAFAFGVPEITALAKNNASRNLGYVEAYFVIVIFYIVLNLGIELLFKLIEKRIKQKKTSTK